MRKKFAVIRSEQKLSELSPSIRKLYDRKMTAIITRKEEQKAEEEETTQELLETIIDAIVENSESTIQNAKKIEAIAKQTGLSLPEEEEE